MCRVSRVCVVVLLALVCIAGVSDADDYSLAPITDTNLNGVAASGEMSGNPRYFDWDTPDEPHLAWVSEDIFAGGSTSIVVADDTVFVYCTGSGEVLSSDYTYMVALDATNGEMLWATEIAPSEYGSWASPAYHNGSVFIASGAHVYRINGGDGAILWDYPFSDCCANCNAGLSISGGRVYVPSFYRSMHPDHSITCPESKEGNLFCLDVGTGVELWNTSTYLPPLRHLGTPTPKYGRIYYGRGGDLYCLTMDGAVVWNTSLKHDVFSAPVIVDGVVYASTYEFGMGFGGFNCLDAFNGSILWNYPVQRTDSTPAYFAPGDLNKKYVYVVGGRAGFSESGVYCFNATNGSLIWDSKGVGSWTNSPAVSRDAKVFVGVAGGSFGCHGLKCLDAYNGTELWSSPYGGSSPYIAYGRIYTIGGNRLYAFGKRELPDLVVTAASASGGMVHATIKNNGTGGTNESFRVALRQSGSVIDECTVGQLNASESVAVTLDLHGACGDLEVYADSGGDVPERDEYNNMRGLQVPCEHPEYHNGWHQFQKDAINTGITSDAAPRSDPELVWSMQTGAIDVPPVVAGNLMYVYDANGTIRAFDKRNGNLVWRNETSPQMLQSSTPAYGDGKVFVAERNGDLYAFDAVTGDRLWKAHVTDYALTCPVTYCDHRIYIGESYCKEPARYFCYDDNGTLIWSSSAATKGAFEWCGASVVGDYLIYPSSSGHLISLFRENGTLSGEIDLADNHSISFACPDAGRIRASVSYHGGYVYVTSENLTSEGYLWKIGFDSGKFIDEGFSTQIGFSTSTSVIYDGRVYAGQGEHGCSGNLTCLNDSTGEIIWSYPVPAGVKSSPALSIGDDGVYIYFTTAMGGGSLYCLRDCGTFAVLAWEYNPPDDGYILQGAAISDGFVYFGTGGGYVYCIGRRGDINHDGSVTAADALIALQMAVSAVPAALVGDMNGDGKVTSLDALMIMQVAGGRSRI